MSVRDLVIIGAGPSGLAAAIAAQRHGLDYQVLEKGVLVNSIYRFPPQMVFFTTPELLEVGGLPFVSPYEKPTRAEALKYYRRVVDTFDLQIAFDEAVESVEREDGGGSGGSDRSGRSDRSGGSGASGGEAHRVLAVATRSGKGVRRVRQARNVVFAIGYYDRPVMIGVPGEDLPHVSHYYSEPHIHYRQRVVIVGGGNSAAESALEMFRAGAYVTVVHRAPQLKSTIKYWVRPDIENRIKEGSIAARFGACVKEIRSSSVVIVSADGATDERRMSNVERRTANVERATEEELPADAVYLLTGYRADSDLMCRAGILLNERQAPVYDPQTFETNVPGVFIAGGAIAGVDTGTIFIENGRFHGEKIVDVIVQRQ